MKVEGQVVLKIQGYETNIELSHEDVTALRAGNLHMVAQLVDLVLEGIDKAKQEAQEMLK